MKFDVEELREIVKKNRDAHRAIFEEALEGYRTKAIEELESHVARIKRGELIHVAVYLSRPEDHTRDYDRLLKMLEMTHDSSVELTENQFAWYVLDDWQWKRQFLTSNSEYSSTAALTLREMGDA